jgi:hypothetical protein
LTSIDVSICMPYFERGPETEATLQSFIERGYFDPDSELSIEVSICDDGSIDEPVRDLEAWRVIPENRRILTELPKKDCWMSATTPINRAVSASRAPFIVLQSPETMHPTPIVPAQIRLMRSVLDVISAPTKTPNDHRMKRTRYWYAHPKYRPAHLWWCQMFTRELWDEIGGIDDRYRQNRGWEDIDLLYSFMAAGANFQWTDPKTAYAQTVFLANPKKTRRRHETHRKSGMSPMNPLNPNFRLFHEKWGENAWKNDKPHGF